MVAGSVPDLSEVDIVDVVCIIAGVAVIDEEVVEIVLSVVHVDADAVRGDEEYSIWCGVFDSAVLELPQVRDVIG